MDAWITEWLSGDFSSPPPMKLLFGLFAIMPILLLVWWEIFSMATHRRGRRRRWFRFSLRTLFLFVGACCVAMGLLHWSFLFGEDVVLIPLGLAFVAFIAWLVWLAFNEIAPEQRSAWKNTHRKRRVVDPVDLTKLDFTQRTDSLPVDTAEDRPKRDQKRKKWWARALPRHNWGHYGMWK